MYAGHFDFTVPLLDTIEGVWTAGRCDAMLARVAAGEWLPATVNASAGRVVNEKLRNNDLAIVRDEALGDAVFACVQPHLPPRISGQRAVGLFQPLRVYRYLPGQHFGLHQDQSYERDDGARSLLTLMIYLDDGCEGGETDFPEQGRRISPRKGDALWFQHRLLHAGLPVRAGVKHVLRSDVLFAG